MYREWLTKGLMKPGKSQVGLARATGISPSVINRMVNGSRPIRDHEIIKISKYIEEAPPSSTRPQTLHTNFELVPVVGVAQDGAWRDSMGAPLRAMLSELPAPPSKEYPGKRQAVQLAVPLDPGSNVSLQFLFFVPAEYLNRPILEGDTVYAEIRQANFIQHTALRVMGDGRNRKFASISDPKVQWKSKDVTVLGLVTGTHIEYGI